LTNPPQSPFSKGEVSPPFGKWFDGLTISSLSREGGREGFKKHFVFCLQLGPFEGPTNIKPPALPEVR